MHKGFKESYFALHHYRMDDGFEVHISKELSPTYPAAMVVYGEKRILLLCPELDGAVDEVREAFRGGEGTIEAVMAFLFDKGVTFSYERAVGCFHPGGIEVDESTIRPLAQEDAFKLKLLLRACVGKERRAAQVELSDDVALGWFDETGALMGAGGGLKEGGLLDLAIIVHPGARGKGIGVQLTEALCKRAQEMDLIPHYRYEEKNKASARLAQKLGFQKAYTLTGARAHYPED